MIALASILRRRLKELELDQRDLAAGAQVTESYISQLLAERKAPPAPSRTDIYERMEKFLALPAGELSRLAAAQHRERLKRRIADPPPPLFKEIRELAIRKCNPERTRRIREIFEKEPFGEFERLVTQKLLDLAKKIAREELASEKGLRRMARLSRRSYEQMRVEILEFLDTDVSHLSVSTCVSFMNPLIESWDIDLDTFGMEIVLNRRLAPAQFLKRLEFVEREPDGPAHMEQGFADFVKNPVLSGGATELELDFLKRLRFTGRRPNALYYYRELQNLRDPLHFHEF